MSAEEFAPSGASVAEIVSWTADRPATLETSTGLVEGKVKLEFNGSIVREQFGDDSCPDVLRFLEARWVVTDEDEVSIATTARGELRIGGVGFPERLALWAAVGEAGLEALEPELAGADAIVLSDACEFVEDGGCNFALYDESAPERKVAISTSW